MRIRRAGREQPRAILSISLCLAFVLSLSPVSASSASPLIIEGDANTSTRFVLSKSLTLDAESVSASTDGTYAGVAIYSETGGRFYFGTFVIPSWQETGQPIGTITYSRSSVRLKPGAYRAYLLGDAPSKVEIPVSSGRVDRVVRTSRNEPDAAGEVLDLSMLPFVQHGEGRVAADIPPASEVFVAVAVVAEHHQAGVMEACVAQRDAPACHLGGEYPSMSAAFASPGSVGSGYSMTYGAGRPSPGPRDLLFRASGVGKADHLLAFYVILPLVR